MDWILCTTKKPNTHKVKFKDCHGNQFIGNYSKDTDDYYAYGINRAIDGVIKWMPQDASEDNTTSFTIAQMEDAFLEGKGGYYDFKQYMKEEYDIDI